MQEVLSLRREESQLRNQLSEAEGQLQELDTQLDEEQALQHKLRTEHTALRQNLDEQSETVAQLASV